MLRQSSPQTPLCLLNYYECFWAAVTSVTVCECLNLCTQHTQKSVPLVMYSDSASCWKTVQLSDTWEHTQLQFRNVAKRVSNATGMLLTGEMQLILTSKTFRFLWGSSWYLVAFVTVISILTVTLLSSFFLQCFFFVLSVHFSTSVIFLGFYIFRKIIALIWCEASQKMVTDMMPF